MVQYTEEHLRISLEDVGNLRRMHVQQFKRLVGAKERDDAPAGKQALMDLAHAHVACADLFDVVEFLLRERLGEQPR